jgi:hypothetical protein
MPAEALTTGRVLDPEEKTLESSTRQVELKADNGKDYIEGYVATKKTDSGNDRFTADALRQMADELKSDIDSFDVYFPSFTQEDLAQAGKNVANNGNIDHNNSPGGVFGDPRIVPAFKMVDAEFDGYGVRVRGVLNTDGMLPEQSDAVKNAVQQGFLNALSVEWVPEKVDYVEEDGEEIRVIENASVRGAALTGRPMNESARLTDTSLKSVLDQVAEKVEYEFDVGEEVSWSDTSGTVRDRTKDGSFSERIDGDVTVNGSEENPAYLIEADNEEGTMVAHRQETLNEKSAVSLKAEYEYSSGDWVERDWSGGEVYGRIRDRTKDQFTVSGNTITGEEDEPVYKMEEYDEEQEEFTGQMIAVPQSGLDSWQGAPEKSLARKAVLAHKAMEDVDLSPPDKVVNAAEAALEAKEELGEKVNDCGTGVGQRRAQKIVDDNLKPADFMTRDNGTPYPTYLDSHEDDVSVSGPPTDWSMEEFNDCGNLQYAMWGHYKSWFEGKKDELESAAEKARAPRLKMLQLLVDTQEQAMQMAERLGMSGTHSHMMDGNEMYMPGESHDDYMSAVEDLSAADLGEALMMADDAYQMDEKKTAAGVEFTDTMEGELDESEIPNDTFEQHYLYPGDTKSESSYPVVDADGNLRRGNVDAANSLGARGGVEDDDLDQKLMQLNDEFDNPPIDFKDSGEKSNHRTMSDQSTEEAQPDSLEELRDTVEEVKQKNEELREENEQLQEKVEDFEASEELKSNVDDLVEELKSSIEESGPSTNDPEEKTEQQDAPAELKSADAAYIRERKDVLAEKYDMTQEEVIDYAN